MAVQGWDLARVWMRAYKALQSGRPADDQL
jgi:hypothetical protein